MQLSSSRGEAGGACHRLEYCQQINEDYQNCKPDPEPYLRVVERLGLPNEKCLVIEDSERGLRAAKAAGLTCWVIPHGLSRHGNFAQADRMFGKISDVAEELLRQVGPQSL